MTHRIDHVAEALLFERSSDAIITGNHAVMAPHMLAVIELDKARLHAQLAMVEQQRIANLIEMARFSHTAEDNQRLYTNLAAASDWRRTAGEALGLS